VGQIDFWGVHDSNVRLTLQSTDIQRLFAPHRTCRGDAIRRSAKSRLEARAAKWRDYVAGKKILLLLDDVAGHEQVRPLLPGSAASLVLVTSRRRLTALEDAIVISIDTTARPHAGTRHRRARCRRAGRHES
jgi:hypothetical protein